MEENILTNEAVENKDEAALTTQEGVKTEELALEEVVEVNPEEIETIEELEPAIEEVEEVMVDGFEEVVSDKVKQINNSAAKNILLETQKYQDRNKKIYDDLLAYKNKETIIRGTLTGIRRDKDKVYAVCNFNDVTVLIPSHLYFSKDFRYGEEYDKADNYKKAAIVSNLMERHIRAVICFTLEAVQPGIAEGDKESFAIGNRVNALEKLKKHYFGIEDDFSDSKVKVGDTVEGYVIFAGYNMILVETLGVETRIDRRDLSIVDEVTENCRDYYKPGNRIKVRVKKMHRREVTNNGETFKDVYLTVSGKFKAKQSDVDNMKIGDIYLGKVEKYKKESDIYVIRLENNVMVNVRRANVSQRRLLTEGDSVLVKITNILDNYCYGRVTSYY